ncbi:MAG: GntR family transcriptional regulator [Pseudonocardiaceae bacterium]
MSEPVAYQRVARDLRDRVLNGTYAPDAKMPSLREIEAEFDVSRATSRAAYQVLISEGIVEGRFGGGYYVRSYRPIIRHGIQRLAGQARAEGRAIWDADPGTAGRELVVDQVQVATEEPPGDIANELNVETSTRTVVRRRRYVLDGKPVLLSTSYFPADIASGTRIEQEHTGPGGAYARLADAGEPPAWFQEDVTARMPSPEEARQLQLPAGTPVLAIRRVVWGPTGRGLEVNSMVGDAGSYVLRYRWVAAQPEVERRTDPA